MWQGGVMTDLGDLGAGYAIAEGINDLGDAVGYSYDPAWTLCATMWRDGTIVNLGLPDGAYRSMAFNINDSRQVVATASYSGGDQPFFWEDGVWTNINDFLPAGSPWVLVNAWAINDAGQIAGYGYYGGEVHAFLLTPDATVPAPGALARRGGRGGSKSNPGEPGEGRRI
jgi:probable HAF family extracellular repeat protein